METLREKVGQMFLVGCQGESLTNNEQLIFTEHQPRKSKKRGKKRKNEKRGSGLNHALFAQQPR
jgi:hypothetical protein